MLQGAAARAQKCRNTSAPNFLQGVKEGPQKCRFHVTPNFLQGVMLRTQQCHTSITSKGAISASRQRHFSHAPTSFIWCQQENAVMPVSNRTKGRVISATQKCLSMGALPHQFSGDTDMTQQCLDHNSPRERSNSVRRNAAIVPPLPTSLTGAITTSQKCYKVNAPREGSSKVRRDAAKGAPFPASYRGPSTARRNARRSSPLPNLGYLSSAETPSVRRPITRGQHPFAEMPTPLRLAT